MRELTENFQKIFDEKRLAAIGWLTMQWTQSEDMLCMLIWRLGHLYTDQGYFVTTDMANISRLNLARNYLKHFHEDHPDHELVLSTLNLFDQCRIKRNDIVHGGDVEFVGNQPAFVKKSAKAGKGQLSSAPIPFTVEDVTTVNTAIGFLNKALMYCCYQIRPDDEPVPSVGKDEIETHLASLLALHPTLQERYAPRLSSQG